MGDRGIDGVATAGPKNRVMSKLIDSIARYAQACVAHWILPFMGISKRYRSALYETVYVLGWRKRPQETSDAPPLLIPNADARDVLRDPPAVQVLEQDAADGNVSGYELLLIAQLARNRGVMNAFEIGTFDGRTALNLAANIGENGHVFTLDLPPEDMSRAALPLACGDVNFIKKEQSGQRFAGTPYARRITQLYGDSATFDFAPYQGQMDLVFIDGSHSYEYVRNDTEVALRLLKPSGGVILWHDYGSNWWKDLTRALNEVYHSRPEFSTMRHIRGTTLVVWEGKPITP